MAISDAPDPQPPTPAPGADVDVHDIAQKGLFLSFRRVGPQWWRAEIRVNATDSGLSGFRCSGEGFDVSEAISRAATITRAAVNDPLLQALLPPGALIAINAAHEMARAAKRGALAAQERRFSTPMMRNVSSQVTDAMAGTLSGIDPTCIVCADGATPIVKDRRRRSPDLRVSKRFPGGEPDLPVPPDAGVPDYYFPGMSQEQQAAMLLGKRHGHPGHPHHARHHGKRR